MKIAQYQLLILLYFALSQTFGQTKQPVYQDKPYLQDFSIKFYSKDVNTQLDEAYADRNGNIKIYSSAGLLVPHDGQFLYAGTLLPDKTYRTIQDKKISAIGSYENQFVFLDNKTVFSNAWAGTLFSKHELPSAKLFVGGENFTFLISDGKSIHLLKDSKTLWNGDLSGDEIQEIRFQKSANLFWVLGKQSLYSFSPITQKITKVFEGSNLTAFDLSFDNKKALIGTKDGYLEVDIATKKQIGEKHLKLPVTEITTIKTINDKVWFGTSNGAFALRTDGKFDYYNEIGRAHV